MRRGTKRETDGKQTGSRREADGKQTGSETNRREADGKQTGSRREAAGKHLKPLVSPNFQKNHKKFKKQRKNKFL